MKQDKGTTITRLSDYRPPDFAIPRVSLVFRLDPSATEIDARLEVVPHTAVRELDLVGDGLSLRFVRLDGELLAADRYTAAPDRLVLHSVPERPFTVEIGTVTDPKANTQLMGLYLSNGTYCTQCEAEGFRRITYFLDRPDVLSVYTTRIEADPTSTPVLLGNGNPVERGETGVGGGHFAVWHDPFPKPCYLFALVAGDLGAISDSFHTLSGREVALNIHCEHGKEARCRYAMDALKRAMRWDERAFGREYDLDVFNIVAISDFNMGAMENKGLNVFNDKYVLADADTATDADYAHIETVIAHEYFHNWTGNRITCRDWFQLCLKEGLTVFRDQEFSSDMRSRPVKRIADVRTLHARQFPEDAGPLAHPVRPEAYAEINNFYTPTVYEKGAEVVRMLATLLGRAGFRAGMDLYFERHDGEAVTIEDFLAAFADATGADLTRFKLWYSQAGTPVVTARGAYDPQRQTFSLSLAQRCPPTPGQPTKTAMHIPLRYGLVGANGADLAHGPTSGGEVADGVIHLTAPSQTIVFHGVTSRPVPSLLRGFSAPVKLAMDLPTEDLLFLLRSDADAFNRWQAGQTLATRMLTAATVEIGAGRQPEIDDEFALALGEVAADDTLEPALRAQALQLPGEADIAHEIGADVDPDAIAMARNALRGRIAGRVGETLGRLAMPPVEDGPFSADATSAGRRALANAALELWVAGGEAEAVEETVRRYRDADNMTDRVAALAVLVQAGREERHAALADFHERYRDDALVLDKWLTLEASAPVAGTLRRVQALIDDPGFARTNPNRIRALIGGFAANQTQFNRPDGAGYAFLADFVIDLDGRNAQMAARLLGSLRSWRALEAKRRHLAEAALSRVANTTGLSTDTRDIVTRMLA